MRAIDRDLIRGGHYGQRPCVPHLKAEHMAAPTNAAYVKKILANPEPSTHGTSRQLLQRRKIRSLSAHSGHYSGLARDGSVANNPKATSGAQKIEKIGIERKTRKICIAER